MKTKMKKYGDGGTKATTRGIQANPVAEANRLKAYPTTKVSKVRAMKTGGMVNPNAKVQAAKVAGSKGVKPGVNPKAVAAKKATGKSSGGVDTPPTKAVPSAMYGRMMKKGGMVKAKKK